MSELPVTFVPCPENIFSVHIQEYFERSKAECHQIEAIYGKWDFEDLIPGLSDFDARFILSDDTRPSDWVHISRAIGRVHTEICREYPDRARILEHLPGINLKWEETRDPLFYYPEFNQWTAYHGSQGKISNFQEYLSSRSWSIEDELFCIKKFALYFTPYNRSIDPPINLHEFESKYPLHSRFMHYFCPPVQCAVCIKQKRMVRGKTESLRLAGELFPKKEVINLTFDVLGRHYEFPEYYREPGLSEIESMLFEYLKEVYRIIRPEITVIDADPEDSSGELRQKLSTAKIDLMGKFYEGAKFCRLMMGRILFYSEEIPHFESTWLTGHELRRIRRSFFETTFTAFGLIAWGEELSPEEVLDKCRGEFLNESEYNDVRAYAEIFSKEYNPSEIKEFAVEVAETMGPFMMVLEKLGTLAKKIVQEKPVQDNCI